MFPSGDFFIRPTAPPTPYLSHFFADPLSLSHGASDGKSISANGCSSIGKIGQTLPTCALLWESREKHPLKTRLRALFHLRHSPLFYRPRPAARETPHPRSPPCSRPLGTVDIPLFCFFGCWQQVMEVGTTRWNVELCSFA